MPQRATWRVRHQDPKTWIGWLARDAKAPAIWISQRLATTLNLLAFMALVSGNWFSAVMCFIFASVPEQIVNALLSMWGGRFVFSARQFVPRPLPVDELLTLPPPAPPFPCRVEVSRRGTMLGSDMGIVTFIDGWLHFEGHRTSFSLRRCDASKRSDGRLDLSEGGSVVFEPHDWIAVGDLLDFNLKKRFEANLKSWMRSDSPAGEPVLPPAVFHSSGIARAWSNLVTAVVSIILVYVFLNAFYASTWALLLLLPYALELICSLRDTRRVGCALRSLRPLHAVE